jgi:hypothetical protein
MKIIDLLNKIANGEEVPKKILIKDKVYYLLVDEKHYVYSQSKDIRQWDLFIDEKIRISQNLDLEVTILDENYLENKPLEEKKIPEKLNIELNSGDENKVSYYRATNLECDIAFKINEIIDYFEYLKSKGDE